MNYKNIIKNNLKLEKTIGEIKETSNNIFSSVVGFVKEKKDTVNEIYNAKKDDLIKRSIYSYAIAEVDRLIIKSNPSMENPILITKDVKDESEMILSVVELLEPYDFSTKDKYVDVLFEVLKLHFSNEPQLTLSVQNESFLIFINEDEIEDEVVEEKQEVTEDNIELNVEKEESKIEE